MATDETKGPTRRELVLERARMNSSLIQQDRDSLDASRRGEKGISGPQVFAEAEARAREAEERRRREREAQHHQTPEEKQPREGV